MKTKPGAYRRLAIKIIDRFCDLLREHDIQIPDDCRTGSDDESPIYGEGYYRLEDEITFLLCDQVLCVYGTGCKVRLNPNYIEEHPHHKQSNGYSTVIEIDENERLLMPDEPNSPEGWWAIKDLTL